MMKNLTLAVLMCGFLGIGLACVPNQITCAEDLASRVGCDQPGSGGQFCPICVADGKYNAYQAWGSSGLSWCIDPLTGAQDNSSAPQEDGSCKPSDVLRKCASNCPDDSCMNGQAKYPGQAGCICVPKTGSSCF